MQIAISHRGIELTESMLKKAERAVRLAAERVPRATSASVRFNQQGPERRVEIVFSAARGTRLVATANGRFWGPVLSDALAKLVKQANRARRAPARRRL